MATTNLSIKYRPCRIGFLVIEGKIDDLVKTAGINTMLWGGIYNPIIPVSKNKHYDEKLIDLFNVDILYAVSHTKEIKEITEEFSYLKGAFDYTKDNLFLEGWFNQKKNIIGYLDSINIVDYYLYKEGLKFSEKNFKSNFVIIRWYDKDKLKNLFAISFGYFPTDYNLEDNYENAFLKGLKSKEIKIKTDQSLSIEIANNTYPMRFTRSELDGSGRPYSKDGIYIGSENNFDDLLYFWNLRASGLNIEFLPINHIKRYELFIQSFLKNLDNLQRYDNLLKIFCLSRIYKDVEEILERFKSRKHFDPCYIDRLENGLDATPVNLYFDRQDTLANVDKPYDRYNITISLPNKKFLVDTNRNIMFQNLAVSVSTLGEFGYPEHTLKPPFIRKLNTYYGREIAFEPYKLRSEKDGIRIIIDADKSSLSLYPLSYESLINKIFELAGYKSEISQPGLILKRIIEKLNGLRNGEVFKIRGGRRLLNSLKKDEFVTRGEATNRIFRKTSFKEIELKSLLKGDFSKLVNQFFNYNEEKKYYYWKKIEKEEDITEKRLMDLFIGDFNKFRNLYIEKRENKYLCTNDVFDFLLKKDVFRVGLDLICNYCNLSNYLPLKDIDDTWICKYCGSENKTSLHLKNRGDWRFRKSGFFAKDNNQEGAIPVILTLLVFSNIVHPKLIYSPSLNLKCGSDEIEIDFCVLNYDTVRRGPSIQIGIGECKDEGGKIDKEKIDNMKMIREKLNKIGLDCFLVFSKTADKFNDEEVNMFKRLDKDNIDIILLTNRELESSHPYWYKEYSDNLPQKYALDLKDMAANSKYLYLNN